MELTVAAIVGITLHYRYHTRAGGRCGVVLHGCVEVIELDFFKVSVWRVFVPVSVPTSTRVHVYTSAVPGKEYRLGLYQLPTRVVYVCMSFILHCLQINGRASRVRVDRASSVFVLHALAAWVSRRRRRTTRSK